MLLKYVSNAMLVYRLAMPQQQLRQQSKLMNKTKRKLFMLEFKYNNRVWVWF